MTPKTRVFAVLCPLCVVLQLGTTPGRSIAGPAEDPDAGAAQEDVVEAYLKLSEPGPEHKKLGMRVGRWNVVATMFAAPDVPPMKSSATSTIRPIMGGRYIQERYTGEFMGQEFTGLGVVGYDKGLKKYVSSWIDSMSTGIWRSEGTADESGDVITFVGEYFDPLRETMVKNKYVLTIKSKKSHVAAMYEIAKDGSERKIMELTYTRSTDTASRG